MYWDKFPYFGSDEFQKKKVKVKYLKKYFICNSYPYTGICISCWKKDRTKVQEALNILNNKLEILDDNYKDFIKLWKQGIITIETRKGKFGR